MIAAELLDRRVYPYAEIDRILGLGRSTAQRWIDGYTRGGKRYEPIVRAAATGDAWATWGEFVEVRILAEYRKDDVPTQHLRGAVQGLRSLFEMAYPLASLKPYLEAEGRELALDLARLLGNDDEGRVIARTGQMLLEKRGRSVIDTASLAAGATGPIVVEVPPDSNYASIVVNPDRRGGEPTVIGRRVTAAAIAGLVGAGESLPDIAAEYEISLVQARSAVDFCAGRGLAA